MKKKWVISKKLMGVKFPLQKHEAEISSISPLLCNLTNTNVRYSFKRNSCGAVFVSGHFVT